MRSRVRSSVSSRTRPLNKSSSEIIPTSLCPFSGSTTGIRVNCFSAMR